MDHFVALQMIHVTYERILHQRITHKNKKTKQNVPGLQCCDRVSKKKEKGV